MFPSAFSVANYRAFLERVTVRLKPLTLFFGYNSSGKSALLRVLPLIADSVELRSPNALDLESLTLRGGGFGDLVSVHSSSPTITLGIEWEKWRGDVVRAEYRIRNLADRRRQIVDRLTGYDSGGRVLLDLEWVPPEASDELTGYVARSPRWPEENQMRLQLDERDGRQLRILFNGLRPRTPIRTDQQGLDAVRSHLRSVSMALNRLPEQVQWLGSVRQPPDRSYQYLGQPPRRMRSDGKGAAHMLAYDQLEGGELVAEVSAWYERSTEQRLELVEQADSFSLTLGPVSAPAVRVNLADTGEGMAQVFPVIVAAARARRDSTGWKGGRRRQVVALEQPELHLHPEAHRHLAEYLGEIAMSATPPIVLVESHSRSFLLTLQVLIAEQRLDPTRVQVYWVRQDSDGRSDIEDVTFDDLARPVGNWPPGVFTEDLRHARSLIEARERRPRE